MYSSFMWSAPYRMFLLLRPARQAYMKLPIKIILRQFNLPLGAE